MLNHPIESWRARVEAIIGPADRLECDRPLRRGLLDTTVKELDGPSAVWDMLVRHPPRAGWLCVTDALVHLNEATAVDTLRDRIPLDGEWVTRATDTSVHLRHDGDGRWLAAVIRLDTEQPGIIEERRQYVFEETGGEITDQPARLPMKELVYDVAWAPRPDAYGRPVLQPVQSRLRDIVRVGARVDRRPGGFTHA